MFTARRKKLATGGIKKAGSAAKKLGIGVFALYVIGCMFVVFGMMLNQLCGPLLSQGLDYVYFVMTGIISFALMFIGSVFITQKQLYETRDNELLLSMPIPSSYIVISRLISVFTVNLLYSAFPFVPAIVLYFRYKPFSAGTLLAFIAASFMLVLIALVFSAFFGWLLALLTSNSRRKKLITPILMFALFFGYMYFYINIQNVVATLLANGESIAETFKRVFPPLYFYGDIIANLNPVSVLLMLLTVVALMAVMLFLVSRSFSGIVTKNKGSVKYTYTQKKLTVSSPKKAMFVKEFKRFLGSANYIFNCGVGSVFMVIFAAVIAVKGASLFSAESLTEQLPDEMIVAFNVLLPFICVAALTMCAIMNSSAASSISLEGKQFALLKAMPLGFGDVVIPKIAVNFVWGAVPIVLCGAVIAVRLGFSAGDALILITVPLMAELFTSLWGMLCNLLFPKLEWISEVTVIKQSMASLLVVLGGMGGLGLFAVLLIAGINLAGGEGDLMHYINDTAPVALLAFYGVLSGLMALLIKTIGRKKYESL